MGLQPPEHRKDESHGDKRHREQTKEKETVGEPSMRVNGAFLAVIGVFFGIVGIVYWFTSLRGRRVPDAHGLVPCWACCPVATTCGGPRG